MKGTKVYLRAVEKKDVELAWKYINDRETYENLSIGIPFPMNFDNEMDWYEAQRKQTNIYNFAICDISNDNYIGGCGINKIDWNNSSCLVGIFIGDAAYRGRGYGTEAMGLLLDFIFMHMNINRVELRVFSFNKRAIKSYIKNGFVEEGKMRQAIFRYGKYHDEVIMSILREEYFRNEGNSYEL